MRIGKWIKYAGRKIANGVYTTGMILGGLGTFFGGLFGVGLSTVYENHEEVRTALVQYADEETGLQRTISANREFYSNPQTPEDEAALKFMETELLRAELEESKRDKMAHLRINDAIGEGRDNSIKFAGLGLLAFLLGAVGGRLRKDDEF